MSGTQGVSGVGQAQLAGGAARRGVGAWGKRAADLFERRWLLILNVVLGSFIALAALVPILFALGWAGVASPIFLAYHYVCAQIPAHSYFLLGYQMALCARNLAIYSSLFVGSLAFRRVRDWLPPLDWRLWVVTMVPMALDGGTQLFGWRESNWELRTLTGAIFGLGVCWFLLPMVQDAVNSARQSFQPSQSAATLQVG
ncbi:MAG: DUF2085 domain-containing protein [Ktedonobacterales bacterium]|nr:DUF2085 domain-containing protein [Ktedonobacterales bacterium]